MKTSKFNSLLLAGVLLPGVLLNDLRAQAVPDKDKDNVPGVLENGAIVRRNGLYYNNRPLYAVPGNPVVPYYYVFGGDRPLVRFGGFPSIDGNLVLGFRKAGGATKWLLDFKQIEFRYHGGRVEWVASDPAFPGIAVSLHALPLAEGAGLAAQAQVTGAAAGDKLVWMFGAASLKGYINSIDTLVTPKTRYYGFEPAEALNNRVTINDGVIRLEPPRGERTRYTLAACSVPSEIRVVDAMAWQTPEKLLASAGDKHPIACGLTDAKRPVTWIARTWSPNDKSAAAPAVEAEFGAAWERIEALRQRVVSQTPDAKFDFMVRAASPSLEGVWRGKAYGHAGTGLYPNPFLGWRTVIGGAAYAWHERVLAASRNFFESQVTGESYKDHPDLIKRVEENFILEAFEQSKSHPGKDPRYLSKGRLIPDSMSTQYNMQSIFFDQVIEGWRFTADAELEKILRPALELHLDYLQRCFDPDGNGAYESFINTYLTDNQWYNGGDTAEETAFAYRGHMAARDMARRAGDQAAVQRHEAKLALIRKGFFESVWVAKSGHPGAYREQGGHRRLHADAWLPSIVHSLDCPGLFTEEQMASTLHFTEYGLERESRTDGGVRVWPSNWVPSVWSVRVKSPGEEHHLALGYCFAGLPENAMEIIRGCIGDTGFASAVPGNFGEPWAGVDFTDFMAPFARVAVSGVFGYRPDRPNALVTIAPQFPADWAHASLNHPEFKLAYKRVGATERLSVELERESAMQLELPFRGTALKSARLNGKTVQGTIRPGFGRSVFAINIPAGKKAELELEVERALPLGTAQARQTEVGRQVELAVDGGRITELRDAQGVLENVRLVDGKAEATIARNLGNHRVLALTQMGEAPQWRIFDLLVRDPQLEQYTAEKNLRMAPASAKWSGVDLSKVQNGRVTDLFRQEYISPRADTMSARLDKNAYGTWHAAYLKKLPPGIDLSNTWPRRPAPVYEAAVGDLQLGSEFTVEAWVRAELTQFAGARILELGDLSLETATPFGMVSLRVGKTQLTHWPVLSGERTTHIAAVIRGNQAVLCINGQPFKRRPEAVNLAGLSFGPKLLVGADKNGDKRLLGAVERVAITKRAMTEEELTGRKLDSPSATDSLADWRIGSEKVEAATALTLLPKDVPLKLSKTLPELLKVTDGMLETPQGAKFLWAPADKDIAFTSLWDNWPAKVQVPVNKKGDSAWLLVAGSTNPMQVRIANAVLRFEYADGVKEELELVNPMNFWSLSSFGHSKDYDYKADAFALPKEPPSMVQLGSNSRAMVYGWKLRRGVELKSVTLESLSEEVVIGLMGLSVCTE